jgi:hypothetical protein
MTAGLQPEGCIATTQIHHTRNSEKNHVYREFQTRINSLLQSNKKKSYRNIILLFCLGMKFGVLHNEKNGWNLCIKNANQNIKDIIKVYF